MNQRETKSEAKRARYSFFSKKRSCSCTKNHVVFLLVFGVNENRLLSHAGVAELADAYGSGPYGGNPVKVQVLSPAPYECKPGICRVFCFQHSIAHSRNFARTLLRRTSPQNLDIAAQTLARTSRIHHVKHGKRNLHRQRNLSPSPRKDRQQSACRHDSMNKRTNPFPLRNLREEGRCHACRNQKDHRKQHK